MKRLITRLAAAARQVLSDTDTYIFGGMGLIFVGVAVEASPAIASAVVGVLLLAYGVWMLPPRSERD